MARIKEVNGKSYQQLLSELDEVMTRLQAAEIDVDEAVKLYEQGLELTKEVEAKLTQAENKVAKLKSKFDES